MTPFVRRLQPNLRVKERFRDVDVDRTTTLLRGLGNAYIRVSTLHNFEQGLSKGCLG